MMLKPQCVDTSQRFIGCFGQFEAEQTARAIVSLCAEHGDWRRFTLQEIDQHHRQLFNSEADFEVLIGYRWIVSLASIPVYPKASPRDAVSFVVTNQFVKRLKEKAPLLRDHAA